MASPNRPPPGMLDAAAGRDVVYCHACQHQWYRDEGGLACPSCGSDITEIVDPSNDPRERVHLSSASTSPDHDAFWHGADSDPEEENIEDHAGPHDFRSHRSTGAGPDVRHHGPESDVVLQHFVRMLHEIAPPHDPSDPNAGFQSSASGPPRVSHFHRATIRTSPYTGTTSVMIYSGNPHLLSGDDAHPSLHAGDPFQSIFSNVIRDMGPPEGELHGAPPPGFAQGLSDIMNFFLPGSARLGDVVHSQEALDRVITSLMEANPQSNAAPPASEEGLKKLERRPVAREMLNGESKAECPICIDTLEEGQTAAFLPCKHWFHEECVVAWLKEHNTCPICRTPIERNERSHRNSRGNSGNGPGDAGRVGGGVGGEEHNGLGSSGPGPSNSSSPLQAPFPRPGPGSSPGQSQRPSGWVSVQAAGWPYVSTGDGSIRYSRPSSHSQSRLNEAMRNMTSTQREQVRELDRDRNHPGDRGRGSATGVGCDSSRLQRLDSNSPTRPRAIPVAEQVAQVRRRSPTRRGESDREARRQQGGPISWLRDRFTGGSESGEPPGDDERY